MGAKFKSKTHLLIVIRFLIFAPFFTWLVSKFEKSTNMTKKIIFNKKKVSKT
jgi:hypothetical protein